MGQLITLSYREWLLFKQIFTASKIQVVDGNLFSLAFKAFPHTLGDFSFQCIDQVQAHNYSEEIDRLLITKEAYWSAQLFSLAPHGLNKRKEFHSKNRICYN